MTIDPVRLCCGKKASEHHGPQCPDGRVMCCMCFKLTPFGELYTYRGDDKPSDVCLPCGERDEGST